MLRGRAYHICTVSSHFDIFIGEGRSQRLACDAFYHRFPNLRWWSSWKRSLRHLLFFELMRERPPPLEMESPLAVRSLRGGGFPLKPKSQGIQTETMLPSQVPVNLSKGCCGWVQNRRNPLYADVKYSGHCQGHMGRNCSIFSVNVQSESWPAKKFGAQKLINLAFLEAVSPCLPPLRAGCRNWGLGL